MTQEELISLTNIIVYKIEGSTNLNGYIFSIHSLNDETGDCFGYYIVGRTQKGEPYINKLNNTINLLKSGQLRISKIQKDTPAIQDFLDLITEIETPTTKKTHEQQASNYFSGFQPCELKLYKK